MTTALLQVDGLTKSFGGVHAVRGVSLTVAAGEMLALIGPNGAGKSTTFNCINGQIRPDAGSVALPGKSLVGLSAQAIAQAGVGRTFQIAQTFASLTVLENVQMALLARDGLVFRVWRNAGAHQRNEALALLDQVGLADRADDEGHALAYGDVKCLELAIALASRPKLLLMDEPTAGMAHDERHRLMALTKQLVASQGLAVLFTEHSMDVVFGYADRIAVLSQGRLIASGAPNEIRDNAEVQAVYLGMGVGAVSAAPAAPMAHLDK